MAEKHYYEQKKHTESYLIPYFKRHISNFKDLKILEVGCAEGGFIDVLYDSGIDAMGLELSAARVARAQKKNPNIKIITADITDQNIPEKIKDRFDLIVLRDVIEHIPDRNAAFVNLSKLLKDQGYLYITFPPRYSGFAGHQQNGRSFLRYVPYLHIAPNWKIRWLGRMFNERPELIENVILNSRIGLSIQEFTKYYKEYDFEPIVKELFLSRPIYKIKFNISAKRIPNIPFIREFTAFGCEYLLRKKTS